MNSLRLLATVLIATLVGACATPPPPPPPPPHAAIEPPLFYEDLDPYGDWWWHERWGWVYSPYVESGWRPYTVGRWVWTDDSGWLWVSAEPFGWACHHYGRWLWVDDAGWVWIPGRVWAPAWVVWRHGPGVVGWAPLGPGAVWVHGRGFIVTDVTVGIVPMAWVFVDEPDFVVVNVVTVVHHHARTSATLPHTRVVHRPERGDGDRVVNRGVERETIERATGRPITPERVEVRRAPEIERQRPDRELLNLDDRGERRTPTPPAVEVRPLDSPDDDVDRRFDTEKRRAAERHEKERAAPPARQPTDDLRKRQQQELDELEREKEREKDVRKKKKSTPRKVVPSKAPKKRAPPP